jgi:predicted SAM-dependent methyltransferase
LKIKKFLQSQIKNILRTLRCFLYSIIYSGKERYCPVCEKHLRKFGRSGSESRDDVKCLGCGSLERHRLVWLYFTKMTDLFDEKPKKMLHIAPEFCFEKRLKGRIGVGYITSDINNPGAMVKMDITDIHYPDKSFDVIYCSHVLEHVVADISAISELHRVLKRNGWAIILVPIAGAKTFENPSVKDPAERLKVFGQEDHVRIYGRDFIDRLKKAGFKVKVISPSDFLNKDEIIQMGITAESGEIYYCTK